MEQPSHGIRKARSSQRLVIALRFYGRIKSKAGLGADDWLILPALVTVIGIGVALIISPAQELVKKIEFVFHTLITPAYGFIKLSVIYLYRRIFVKGTSSRFDRFTKFSVAIVILWTIAFFFYPNLHLWGLRAV
ncbi:hypothetical protein N7G274_005227 [Stereocaulon virgatum]|uniref:Rhodopsin domain-containing protein n=1 Tax=Stereocaulon virgatum TaxID=373712 RepID=A0ABR4A960_9LECA